MRCVSEEESKEINEAMERFNAAEESKKLKEPDIDEIVPSSIYHKSRKVRTLLGALAMYGAGLSHGQSSSYVAEYEPVNIKGAPGIYNKEKHMSRAQRKKMKSRRNKK